MGLPGIDSLHGPHGHRLPGGLLVDRLHVQATSLQRSHEEEAFRSDPVLPPPVQQQGSRGQPGHDPIFKIRSFVKRLRENFKNVFAPCNKVAVDEAMVAWRGPLAFPVFSPDKPDKFGIKNFELCNSSTACCCNSELYTGKQET